MTNLSTRRGAVNVRMKTGAKRSLTRWKKRHIEKVEVKESQMIEPVYKEGWLNLFSTLLLSGGCLDVVYSFVDDKAIKFVLTAIILSYTVSSVYSFFKNKL